MRAQSTNKNNYYCLIADKSNKMSQKDVSAEAVRQVKEMGFSEEQAVRALQISNGDISEAINLIFNGGDLIAQSKAPDYVDPGYGYPNDQKGSVPIESGLIDDKLQPPTYDYDIPAGGYEAPPEVPPRQPPRPVHIEDVQHPSQSDIPLSYSGHLSDAETQSYNEHQQLEDYSIYDDPSKYQREPNLPSLLMPVRNGILESYLNPFLTVLHEIPAFRKAVYHQKFETLGFNPRWYRGQVVPIPSGSTIVVKDGKTHDLRFLLEVQRVFGFLDGDSERFFADIHNFLKSFPQSARMEFGKIDNISEAYTVFYKALIAQLDISGIENSVSFFESTISDTTVEEDRKFGMFHVEGEEIKRDLYSTINNLIWGEDFENNQLLTRLSDVLTVSFEPSFDGNSTTQGIEIPEKFYPQVYGPDFKDTVSDLFSESTHYDKERRAIAKELMSLRGYNGKSVSSILNTSIAFLSSELENSKLDDELSDALKDLESIKTQTQDKILSFTDKQSELLDKRSKSNPNDINVILKRHGSVPEPYILTGVIISNSEFFYLKKTNELVKLEDDSAQRQWFHVEYEPKYAKDLRIETSDFDYLKRSVYATSQSQYETSIVLIYVKHSTWMNEVECEVPEAVKAFIAKDKLELEKTLELLASSTDEDLSEYEDEKEDNQGQQGEAKLDNELDDADEDKENEPPLRDS